ncbi:MAG: LamG-like jellyroll fold domain-containing protein, partial [Verrucomicrobiales bacterium]
MSNDGKLYATASQFRMNSIHLPGQNYFRNIRESSLIDSNSSTKYVNFSKEGSGFYVTPDKNETIIKSLTITTSNNSLEGDPKEITIFGTNDTPPHLGDGSYSMSAWIKPKSAYQNQMIFGQEQLGMHNGIRNNGRLHQAHWGSDWNGATQLPNYKTIDKNGGWIHALWTWSGPDKTGKIYMDGKLEFEGPISNPDNAIGSLMLGNMGSKSSAGINGYKGLIDEISIWSEVLEEKHIVSLAEGENPLNLIKWNPSNPGATTKFTIDKSSQHLDNDNDSYSNLVELTLGTDPNNSDSTPPKLIGYFNFEQANENILKDLSPWKNNGIVKTPNKIKIKQSGGAPSAPSPENCGEFSDGIIDVPGIKFIDLYSGKFGIKPRWTKIETLSTKLPAQRNKESNSFQISNNQKFNSYKVTFDKIKSPDVAESVQLTEIKFFEKLNSKGPSIFSSSDKIDRVIENDKKERSDNDRIINIWKFGKSTPSLSIELAEGASTWEGSSRSLDFNLDKSLLAIAYENHSHSELINTQDGSIAQKIPIEKLSSVSFSSGGKKILLSNLSGRVIIWDLESESIVLEEESAPNAIPKWSPDEKSILIPNIKNNETALVNIKTKDRIILKHESNVHNIASFSPDGTKVLTLTRGDLRFNVWDIKKELILYRLEHSLGPHSSSNNNQQPSKWWQAAGSFSPQGNKIITFADDMTVKLWDSITGKLLDQKNISSRIKENTEPLFDQSGSRFMIKLRQNNNSYLGTLKNENTQLPYLNKNSPVISGYAHLLNDGAIKPLQFPLGEVISSISIKNDNEILLANTSGEISAYDLSSGKKVSSLTAQNEIKFTDISYDESMIATSSNDNKIVVLNVKNPSNPLLIVEPLSQEANDSVVDISFDQSGENIWISRVKGPELWNIASKKILKSININLTAPYSISSNDKSLFAIFQNSSFRIYYRNETGTLKSFGGNNNSNIKSATFTKDNKHLLLGSIDGVLNIWSIDKTNKLTDRSYVFQEGLEISALASTSDNTQIAAGFVGGFLHLLPFDFLDNTETKKIVTKGSCNDLS